MTRPLKVAVIGAGTAGLATARELQREGHRVVVFEKADRIGGTWVYNPQVEADPLGLEPDREIVHSSLYYSLRTNLPRHLMGFSDYPFTITKNGELNNFPGHEEILKFLNNFARDFGLIELIRFNTEVVRVEQESLEDSHWVVESRECDQFSREELFEAVVVCNGHYTQPRVAELPGIKKWPSKQIHSHNYRVPEPFRSQVVVVIGSGPSAFDISEDIAKVAKEVHLSSRSSEVNVSRLDTFDNVWQHSEVDYCYENGDVAFKDGALVAADVILYCTGYKYDYPFLRTNGIVTVDDNRVGPLYKHVFPPKLAPGLSFVGIPYMSMYHHNVEALERCFLLGLATKENMLKVVIFLMIELQAKWVVRVLSGKALLPSKEEMLADVEEHYRRMEENGVPKRHTHSLRGVVFEYLDWLANQAGLPPVDEIKQIYAKYFQIIGTSYPWIGRVRELDIESLIK